MYMQYVNMYSDFSFFVYSSYLYTYKYYHNSNMPQNWYFIIHWFSTFSSSYWQIHSTPALLFLLFGQFFKRESRWSCDSPVSICHSGESLSLRMHAFEITYQCLINGCQGGIVILAKTVRLRSRNTALSNCLSQNRLQSMLAGCPILAVNFY